MTNKDFIYERIGNFAGKEFDPTEDKQVLEVLRFNFNIHLPQRASVNESLASSTSDHEIIGLILQYRTMS
jgi:DNA polymerase I-like protein with 3'-5' exonuclease and polymerase domains